jgi:hypothetical protein
VENSTSNRNEIVEFSTNNQMEIPNESIVSNVNIENVDEHAQIGANMIKVQEQMMRLKTVTAGFIETTDGFLTKFGVLNEESEQATQAYIDILAHSEQFLAAFNRSGKFAFLCSVIISRVGIIFTLWRYGKPDWKRVLGATASLLAVSVFGKKTENPNATTGNSNPNTTSQNSPVVNNFYAQSQPTLNPINLTPSTTATVNLPTGQVNAGGVVNDTLGYFSENPVFALITGAAVVFYRRALIPFAAVSALSATGSVQTWVKDKISFFSKKNNNDSHAK